MSKPKSEATNIRQPSDGPWSLSVRILVTCGLLAYLFVVAMGPIANPIATEELTGPIAARVAPFHQALYLGHGYRFFAPDPGPSHMIVFKVTRDDGSVIEGRIPDTARHWPRLLYHRWFMLSETIWMEHASTPDEPTFLELQRDLQAQEARFRAVGKFSIANQIHALYQRQQRMYAKARRRMDLLDHALAADLLDRFDGSKIELFCQERRIALPADVVLGRDTHDPGYLGELRKIVEVDRP